MIKIKPHMSGLGPQYSLHQQLGLHLLLGLGNVITEAIGTPDAESSGSTESVSAMEMVSMIATGVPGTGGTTMSCCSGR